MLLHFRIGLKVIKLITRRWPSKIVCWASDGYSTLPKKKQCEYIKPHPCATIIATPIFYLAVTMKQTTNMTILRRMCVHAQYMTLNGKMYCTIYPLYAQGE